jgi:phage terminase small subunit
MTEFVTEKKFITPIQRKAIESLLTTGNTTEAAEAAGISRNTFYRWMADDTFLAALHEAEGAAVAGLSRALAGLGDAAAAALRDALQPSNKITVRLRAAEIVTDRLLKIRELVDIEQRLIVLEKVK